MMDASEQTRSPGGVEQTHNNDGYSRGSLVSVDSATPLLQKTFTQTRSLPQRLTLALQNWFLWEILSATTAVVAMAITVIVLAIYDSSSLPDWPSSITVGSTAFGTYNNPLLMTIYRSIRSSRFSPP